jgi:predicted nucleotidyltransferase component of viral defense system
MISLREVQRLAYEQQVAEQSIERDYILTWILTELSLHPSLGKAAMLKGGTALKKLYYPEWRYSEDLDFTLSQPWKLEAITTAIGEVCLACQQSSGLEVNVATEEPRYDGEQLRSMTIYIAYIGPLRRTRRPRELKIDFTADEVIVAKPVKRPLKRMYSDEAKPARKILCYTLEEIFAEKMRTILQRTEPRDLYIVKDRR